MIYLHNRKVPAAPRPLTLAELARLALEYYGDGGETPEGTAAAMAWIFDIEQLPEGEERDLVHGFYLTRKED